MITMYSQLAIPKQLLKGNTNVSTWSFVLNIPSIIIKRDKSTTRTPSQPNNRSD